MNARLPGALVAAIVLAVLAAACGTVLGVDFDAPRLADTAPGDGRDGGVCIPKRCGAPGLACGTQNDGCGAAIECGVCPNGGQCAGGACSCTPKTCPDLGATCGVVDNGCGATLDCGKCGNATEACLANKCQCQPQNCTVRGANCGDVPDGCGNTYTCGSCKAPEPNCGGGGPNKCGANACVPLTCAGRCGDVSDECGTILHCGGCAAPQTCGGGGTANVCGCTPTSCAQQGKNCGTIPDGCGGTLDCLGCAGTDSCGGGGVANVCGCTPLASCPAGASCGTVPDNCGGNVACGACVLPQSCGGGGVANVCGCTPRTCDLYVCGSHANGCGGTINCGSCACFPAGTRVTMADGTDKPIERVVAGDLVRSPDPATGAMGVARVVEAKVHPAALSRAGLVVVDGTLRATRNHPIWVNGSVVEIEQLRAGDQIVVADGRGAAVTRRVSKVALEPGGMVTFDLVLSGGAYYFAGGVMIQQKQLP
jgi:hypothetical protein